MDEYCKSPKGYCYKKKNGISTRISLEEFNEFKKNIKKYNQEGGGIWSRLIGKKEKKNTNNEKVNTTEKKSFWERWIWQPKNKKQQINTRNAERKAYEGLKNNSWKQVNNMTKERNQKKEKKERIIKLINEYSDKKRGVNLNLDKINNDKRDLHEYLSSKNLQSSQYNLKNSLNTIKNNLEDEKSDKFNDYDLEFLFMKLNQIKELREQRENKILTCSKRQTNINVPYKTIQSRSLQRQNNTPRQRQNNTPLN